MSWRLVFSRQAIKDAQKIFKAYAQQNTPGAYRVFWRYGPDEIDNTGRRVPVIR